MRGVKHAHQFQSKLMAGEVLPWERTHTRRRHLPPDQFGADPCDLALAATHRRYRRRSCERYLVAAPETELVGRLQHRQRGEVR